jgi:hypothetical protein
LLFLDRIVELHCDTPDKTLADRASPTVWQAMRQRDLGLILAPQSPGEGRGTRQSHAPDPVAKARIGIGDLAAANPLLGETYLPRFQEQSKKPAMYVADLHRQVTTSSECRGWNARR